MKIIIIICVIGFLKYVSWKENNDKIKKDFAAWEEVWDEMEKSTDKKLAEMGIERL